MFYQLSIYNKNRYWRFGTSGGVWGLYIVREEENREDVDLEFCDYCNYCTCDLDDLEGHIMCCSQMNGNNGSWTNSDDHAMRNDMAKRNHKEAKNKRIHQSGAAHKTKTGNLPQINKLCRNKPCTLEKCRFLHLDDDVSEISDFSSVTTIIPLEKVLKIKNTTFEVVGKQCLDKAGDPVDCEFENFRLPAFDAMGRHFDGGDCVMWLILYDILMANLRVLPNEPRNYTAIHNFVIDNFRIFEREVIDDTIKIYLYRNSFRSAPCDVKVIAENNHICVNSHMVVPLVVDYAPQPEYTYNCNWRILGSNGFQFSCVGDQVTRYPKFNTEKPLRITDKNKRAMCLFIPQCGFKTYAKCATNICGALSRYFKSKNDEMIMQQRQFDLLGHMPDYILQRCAKLCDATLEINRADISEEEYTKTRIYLKSRPVYIEQGVKVSREFEIPSMSAIDDSMTLVFQRHMQKFSAYEWLLMGIKKVQKAYKYAHNYVVETAYSPVWRIYNRFEMLVWLLKLPHPKNVLYTQYIMDDRTLEKILENTGEVESKFKWEFGKVGKQGRLYGTLNHLTLAEKTLSERMKVVFTTPIDVAPKGSTVKFSAVYSDCQERSQSDRLFKSLETLVEGEHRYIYFSDDGFYVTRKAGKILQYETDISSCDSSNGFSVFALLAYIADHLGFDHESCILLAQAARATILRNPDNYEEFVRLLAMFFFEFSGLNITTILNNIASCSIAYGVAQQLHSDPDMNLEVALSTGANRYGWELAVQKKDTLNSMTFLKRAYNGSCSWKVLGCILRSLGTIDGVMSAEKFGLSYREFKDKSVVDLFEILMVNAIRGLVNEPRNRILDAFRERFGVPILENGYVSDQDLIERYGLETYEIDVFVSQIHDLRVGDCIVNNALEKIYHVDYGTKLSVPEKRIRRCFGADIRF